MKNLFTLLIPIVLSILFTTNLNAQAPEKMNYQAVIRNASGELVTNTKVGVRIRVQKYILGFPPSYQDIYVETHSVYKTNENGLLTLIIGEGEIVTGTFADIDWSDGTYILKTETDPEGGTNYSVTGSSQILSVPYALHAKNVKTYKVGDFARGGIVFWVDETGEHGLVCAKEDQRTGIRWYAGTNGSTQARGDGPFAGEANTSIIISAQVAIGDDNATYAARICNELQVTEGDKTYGDWYLPSRIELDLMYQNKATIDASAEANGGSAFAGDWYWSSTESLSNAAWKRHFLNGDRLNSFKDDVARVRAIRSF